MFEIKGMLKNNNSYFVYAVKLLAKYSAAFHDWKNTLECFYSKAKFLSLRGSTL